MKAGPDELQRYDDRERLYHWVTALLLFAAACSGMAFFHPSLFFLSIFTGGGPWTRILHPFIGVATVLVFFLLYLRVHNENKAAEHDKAWNAKMSEMLRGNKEHTFRVSDKSLLSNLRSGERVTVSYEKQGKDLIARDIHPAAAKSTAKNK